MAPADRDETFTDKCVTGAQRLGVALIQTSDMFNPARYLKEAIDDAYAKACREAIFGASGTIVIFPNPPLAECEVVAEDADNDNGLFTNVKCHSEWRY